jgi:hypothetical protein
MADSTRRELTIITDLISENMIAVSVADTGPGLSPDVRPKLFEPFVTTKASGLGVGLSICRAIIEAHGGELCAEDNPGGGTIFRFTLPQLPSRAAEITGEAAVEVRNPVREPRQQPPVGTDPQNVDTLSVGWLVKRLE